jgi:hypothetical protein
VENPIIEPFKCWIEIAQDMSDEDASDMVEETPDSEEDESVEEKSTSQQIEKSEDSLRTLQAGLKRSKWSVFLFVGITVVMFGFALFPMPTSIPYDPLWGNAQKDIGFVWGPSASGEDLMDVPFDLEVEVIKAPSVSSTVTLEAYVLKLDDCQDLGVSEFEQIAKEGRNHDYQYLSKKGPLEGETYTFEFKIDMGQHCVKVQYVNDQGNVLKENTDLKAKGKLWPNQVIAGIPGFIFFGVSIYTVLGFLKKRSKVNEILEQERKEEEKIALEEATAHRISQGPGGPPKSASGPSGPPKPQKRSGPPKSSISNSSGQQKRSGPPPASSEEKNEPVQEEIMEVEESVYEPAGNGYFYRKMADGTYEQTIYVQSEDGTYTPYEE